MSETAAEYDVKGKAGILERGVVLRDDFDDIFEDDNVPVPQPPVHEDNADPIVPPRQVSTQPGRMRTQGEIEIHTRIAHRLFYGRRRDYENKIKAIIGLVRFSMNVNGIFECAANDDPWADAALLEIEDNLTAADSLVKENIKVLNELLEGMDGLKVCSSESVRPVTLPVEFKTVYGFLGARLLGQYDKMVKLTLVARHVSLLLGDDFNILVRGPGTKIRNAFLSSTRYRHTGATRNDVAANNEVARRATAKYGELPQDVLKGLRRAKHAPVIRSAGTSKLAQHDGMEMES